MGDSMTDVTANDSIEFGEAFFANAREALLLAEKTAAPMSMRDRMILDKLSDEVFALHSKGVSFDAISSLLRRSAIVLSASTISQYVEQMQSQRLAVCEQLISDCVSQNAVSERAAFIEQGLRVFLETGVGLSLKYQPQVDMRDGCVVGAEALLRWNAKGSIVSPVEFIAVAESTGLIVPIGEWVLREACREAKRWQARGLVGNRGVKMSVNLSPKQFSEKLPDMVHGILCDSGLSTNMLGLEITETTLVSAGAFPILQQLSDSGVQLSIDDFGTGYSCLAELQEMPLETLKIDRAFVRNLGTTTKASIMVEIIISLATRLGMATVAEGVETEAQAQALLELGCTVCQGFLYAQALTGDEFVEFSDRASHRTRSGSELNYG